MHEEVNIVLSVEQLQKACAELKAYKDSIEG